MLAWRAVEQALAQIAGEATVSTEADSGDRSVPTRKSLLQ
jgi:hypothetical protein